MRPPFDSQVGAHNSNFTMVYGAQITIVTGAFVNQLTSLVDITIVNGVYNPTYNCGAPSSRILFLLFPNLTSHLTSPRRVAQRRSLAGRSAKSAGSR